MVAMTARSKNSVLSMEKKQGWSIQLPELRFPWDSHEDKGFSLSLQGSGPSHGGLFASVGLKVSTGAPAVAPGPGDQGAMGAEFRLAALERLAVELRLAEIVADNAAGSETRGADAIGRVVPAQFDHF